MAALCLLGSVPSQADQPPEVGVVVNYTPDWASLYLQREGAAGNITVQIGTVVRAGDQIVLPSESTVTVELAEGRQIVSSGPGSWTVPPAPALGWVAAVFRRLERALSPEDTQVVSAISRSSADCTASTAAPIQVPALGYRPHIKAGERGLSLAWTGSCQPYRLAVQSDGRTIAVRRGLKDQKLRLEKIDFRPGRYSVLIQGSGGLPATFWFEATVDSPELPKELSGDASHLQTIARALWLAEAEQGNWRLDGIEELVPLAGQGDPLARRELQYMLWSPVIR